MIIMISKDTTASTLMSNRCEVNHYTEHEESMRCPFSEDGRVEVWVRQSERQAHQSLIGVLFRVYKNDFTEWLSAQIPSTMSGKLKCRTKSGADSEIIKTDGTHSSPSEWYKLELLFTENRTLVIPRNELGQNDEVKVCNDMSMNEEQQQQPSFLTLTLQDGIAAGLHMICNCYNGTPVFPHDTLPRYNKHWRNENEMFYVRAVWPDGGANLTLQQYVSSSQGGPIQGQDLTLNITADNITNNNNNNNKNNNNNGDTVLGIWVPVIVKNMSMKIKNQMENVVVLAVGDLAKVVRRNNSTKRLALVIDESRGLEWTVNTPPTYQNNNHIPSTASTTPIAYITKPKNNTTDGENEEGDVVVVDDMEQESSRWDIVFFTVLVVWLSFITVLVLLEWRRVRGPVHSHGETTTPNMTQAKKLNSRPQFPLPPEARGGEEGITTRQGLLRDSSFSTSGAELNMTTTAQQTPRDSSGMGQLRPRDSSGMGQLRPRDSSGMGQLRSGDSLQIPTRSAFPLHDGAASDDEYNNDGDNEYDVIIVNDEDNLYDYVDLTALRLNPDQGQATQPKTETQPKRGMNVEYIKHFIPCLP
ncbi:hypothetical protein Pmani_032639 [Petrolisthes manimaculis]|uniref:Uncharacterized protein n=1 Tax=Petrolisthes manimaculis TaxID=1843537 RepID=A0AAE1TRH4_9EUCA|nr:hypothetical protein Pmani_032639 [Petrolisthes manimaculis]